MDLVQEQQTHFSSFAVSSIFEQVEVTLDYSPQAVSENCSFEDHYLN